VKVWELGKNAGHFLVNTSPTVSSRRVAVSQLDVYKGMLSGVSSAAQNKSARCVYFERGRCRLGSSCRYLHIVETTGSQHQDESLIAQDPPLLAEGQNSTTSAKPCRYFFRTGWCAFGSSCRFRHDSLSPAQISSHGDNAKRDTEKPNKPEDTEALVCGKQDVGEQNVQKKSDGRKPCRFFKRGYCHFGQRCRQAHIAADGSVVTRDVTNQRKKMGRGTGTAQQSEKQRDQTDKEAQNETAQADKEAPPQHLTQDENQAPSEVAGLKQKVDNAPDVSDELEKLRTTEIQQLRRRYPRALIRELEDGTTAATFVFEPSDPDWVWKLQLEHCIYK